MADGDTTRRCLRDLLTVPALLFSLYALADHSSLWPLTLIFAAAIGVVYLAALWLLRWQLA